MTRGDGGRAGAGTRAGPRALVAFAAPRTRRFLSSASASLLKCIDQRSFGERLAGCAKQSHERGTRKIEFRIGQPCGV